MKWEKEALENRQMQVAEIVWVCRHDLETVLNHIKASLKEP